MLKYNHTIMYISDFKGNSYMSFKTTIDSRGQWSQFFFLVDLFEIFPIRLLKEKRVNLAH